MDEIILETPEDFNFSECLVYLNRSELECLHRVVEGTLIKLIPCLGQYYLIQIIPMKDNQALKITLLTGVIRDYLQVEAIKNYVRTWFDLETSLTSFYELGKRDSIVRYVTERYRGLRIVKIMDLFEGFCWSVIGQQINLKFAYTLKKRLIETYGESITFQGERYYLFPTPERIACLRTDDLKDLQFSGRKAEYVTGIANLFCQGALDETQIKHMESYEMIKEKLLKVRGIGHWTADYIMLKCLDVKEAFPIADVGIHNAIKGIMNLEQKPTIAEIELLSKFWKGHEAYVTFYLWRYLYD
ncbi:DNA-3-methyladenine glycosylase family protein [Fusibacter ferrireducens]|uniref:DNA-3-methyladenine glycosylase II n=1 Tax=Fusibacter ferrireducens TaxID=2785058 RepID=A0ABR9ZV64_9FIRM|nr:DNA-3-methyladenine glycosylase [Fusibacter ferrireducens]MBF4693484.1 DNA-3-methyladenine glycosylase 2 family protein [Fusibacter ferrireducens]